MSQALALAEKGDAQVLRILLGHILPRRRELPLKTGSAFVYADRETGRVTTIFGYPTQKISQAR